MNFVAIRKIYSKKGKEKQKTAPLYGIIENNVCSFKDKLIDLNRGKIIIKYSWAEQKIIFQVKFRTHKPETNIRFNVSWQLECCCVG